MRGRATAGSAGTQHTASQRRVTRRTPAARPRTARRTLLAILHQQVDARLPITSVSVYCANIPNNSCRFTSEFHTLLLS